MCLSTRRFGGGVKDRPELKTATYRASEWDIKDFASSNARHSRDQDIEQEIENRLCRDAHTRRPGADSHHHREPERRQQGDAQHSAEAGDVQHQR